MCDKVAKVCLSLVLACTLVVSPFVRAEKAYAFAPAIAAAASAWGVSEGAVVAGVSALAAACGVTFISGTQTGLDWDSIDSVDDFLVISEAEAILAEAAEQNGGGYEPKNNNGGGNFLECVKQLAVVGAITGVGSAVSAGVNFLLDKLLPAPGVSSSIFVVQGSLFDKPLYFGSLPSGLSFDDSSWLACFRLSTSSYGDVFAVYHNVSNVEIHNRNGSLLLKLYGTSDLYSVSTLKKVASETITSSSGSRIDDLNVILNPKFSDSISLYDSNNTFVGTLPDGFLGGGYTNTIKLDEQYEIANLPADLLASINAAAAAANNAADRSQALADATQAVLDNLASTGSSVQKTPTTSNDRDDYVTTEPTVKPVEPTEPVDPNAPFDWNQFLQPDLYLVFPFCLPWDIYQVVSLLSSSAEAPVFDLPLKVPVEGGEYKVHIDLSVFDPVAEVIRAMELLAVAAGLIFLTKKMIEN